MWIGEYFNSSRKGAGRTNPFRVRCSILFALLCVLAWQAVPATAQQVTGDIVGTVTDTSGALIPNATVTVKNMGTEETRTGVSTDKGEFTFTLLQPGQYSVSVDAKGFKSFEQSSIALSVGERYRVAAQLTIGEASEKVEVTGEAPALQTDDATLQSVVESKAVEDLPLNGRNFVQLAQLVSGANEGPANSAASGGGGSDYRPSSALVVNGQADVQNNYMLDGTDNNERLLGLLGVRPSIDAIAEVNVLTGQYSAEIGRTAGGVVNVITKSGTDRFHGSAYEFLRNDAFDAKDYFTLAGTKPPLKQNQFGGSVGGPIRKGKTFFFGDYEGFRQIHGQAKLLTVPTLQEQTKYDFTDVGGPALKAGQLSSIALNFFALYPHPNVAGAGAANNYSAAPVQVQNSETFDLRADHRFNDNNTAFVRYSYNNTHTVNPGNLPAANGIIPDGGVIAPELVQNVLGNYTHLFSPTLLLELKGAYTRINLNTTLGNNGKDVSTQFGLTGANYNSLTSGLTNMTIVGYEGLGDATFNPNTTFDSTLQFMGALSFTKGTHSFKFGAAYIRSAASQFQNRWGLGWYIFAPSPPFFNGMANFLTDNPVGVTRANLLADQDLRTSEPAFYAQDNWRVTPKLTMTYGVRYSIFTPYTEARDGIDSFDPVKADLLIAGQQGVSKSADVKADYGNFAPRLGLAYSPLSGTVIRGGFGISYYPDNTGGGIYLKNQPFEYYYSPAQATPMSQGLPTPSAQPTGQADLTGALSGVDKDFKASYAEQMSLNLQQEVHNFVATVGYVGVITRRQAMDNQLNQADLALNASTKVCPAPPGPPGPACYLVNEPYHSMLPNITGGISYQQTHGISNYNGLQATLLRQYSSGVMLNANYTFAHALSDVMSFTGRSEGEGWGEVAQNLGWQNVWKQVHAREYSNSDFAVRHRVAMQIAYQLPFGKSLKGIEGELVKGWNTNGIFVWQTGEPFTVINPQSTSADTTGIEPPNNGSRPNQTGKATVAKPGVQEWFNTSAFETQAINTLGDERRNSLYGPHFRHLDFSIGKDFRVTETKSFEFRMENFNLTNTPNFGQPNAQMGAGNYGTISQTRFSPRQIQFALKFLF